MSLVYAKRVELCTFYSKEVTALHSGDCRTQVAGLQTGSGQHIYIYIYIERERDR